MFKLLAMLVLMAVSFFGMVGHAMDLAEKGVSDVRRITSRFQYGIGTAV
jgi:hypothetical protein